MKRTGHAAQHALGFYKLVRRQGSRIEPAGDLSLSKERDFENRLLRGFAGK
jgi:hypothetical protein